MELNRQRVVFSRQEAETLPPNRPYVAYICYYDWTEGEHATLMHSHEDLAEVLLILKGSGHYAVDLCRYEVSAGDVVLCNGGALHDEFPQAYERDESAGEAIQISLADMESMMKKGQEFTIAFTQSMCGYCEDFHELFENYRHV